MNKNIIISLIILIAVLVIIMITTPSGHKQEIKALQKQIELVKSERDSLYGQLKITRDGLRVAEYQAELARQESEKAKKQTKYYKDKYEKVRFIDFANDSIRSSELSKLYPSYKNR